MVMKKLIALAAEVDGQPLGSPKREQRTRRRQHIPPSERLIKQGRHRPACEALSKRPRRLLSDGRQAQDPKTRSQYLHRRFDFPLPVKRSSKVDGDAEIPFAGEGAQRAKLIKVSSRALLVDRRNGKGDLNPWRGRALKSDRRGGGVQSPAVLGTARGMQDQVQRSSVDVMRETAQKRLKLLEGIGIADPQPATCHHRPLRESRHVRRLRPPAPASRHQMDVDVANLGFFRRHGTAGKRLGAAPTGGKGKLRRVGGRCHRLVPGCLRDGRFVAGVYHPD